MELNLGYCAVMSVGNRNSYSCWVVRADNRAFYQVPQFEINAKLLLFRKKWIPTLFLCPNSPDFLTKSSNVMVWTHAPAMVRASKRRNSPWLPRVTALSCHHLLSGNTAMRAGHAIAASSQIWWRDTNVHVVQELMMAALGTKMENISVTAWREWKTKEKKQDKTETQNWNMKFSECGDILANNAIISNMQACDRPGVNPGRLPWKALLWIPWKVGQISAYS